MFAKSTPRPDFADTLSIADGPWAWSSLGRAEGSDARDLMASVDAADRHLLRLVLLHRYSCLPAQMKMPGWDTAPDFATLAARWCP